MAETLITVLEFIYKKSRMPGSNLWILNNIKSDVPPIIKNHEPFVYKTENKGDEFRFLISVPCDDLGQINKENGEKARNIAEKELLKAYPNAQPD